MAAQRNSRFSVSPRRLRGYRQAETRGVLDWHDRAGRLVGHKRWGSPPAMPKRCRRLKSFWLGRRFDVLDDARPSFWVTEFAFRERLGLGCLCCAPEWPEKFTGHPAHCDAAPYRRKSDRMGVCAAIDSVHRPRNVDWHPRLLTSSEVRIGAWSTDSPTFPVCSLP